MLTAFDDTAHRYRGRVYSFARYLLSNREEAEDVTQEVLLRLWRHQDGLEEERLGSWLLRVTRNACYDLLRRRRPDRTQPGMGASPDRALGGRRPEGGGGRALALPSGELPRLRRRDGARGTDSARAPRSAAARLPAGDRGAGAPRGCPGAAFSFAGPSTRRRAAF